jgi:hypothetical protein
MMDRVRWVQMDTGFIWMVSSFESLMDSISWVQLDTGLTRVVSFLEIFHG